MNKMISALALTIVASLMMACSSSPTQKEVAGTDKKPVAPPSIEAQQVAAEQSAAFVAEIAFAKDSTSLSKGNKAKIQKLVDDAKKVGSVEEVKLVTWADQEYPSVHTKNLSAGDRKLVDNRNKGMEDFIKMMPGDLKVKAYSMAERPNAFVEFVGASDARIKKSLETAGIPTTDTTVKSPSQASKAIILVVLK